MLRNELIRAIHDILDRADLRELDLIYRIIKHMVPDDFKGD